MRSCCSRALVTSPYNSVATVSAIAAMALMRTMRGSPLSSMFPKSAMSCWHAAMNLVGSTSGPSCVFLAASSPKLRARPSLGSKALWRIVFLVSSSSVRSSALSNRFSGASLAMRLSISSRHRFARFFMSSAAPAPAAPAASACCRFASSSSTKGASIWLMMASSWIFANIFSGEPCCMTVPRVAPLRRQREQGVVAPFERALDGGRELALGLGLDELREQRVVGPERVAVEARLARALAPRLARHLGVLLDAGRDGRRAQDLLRVDDHLAARERRRALGLGLDLDPSLRLFGFFRHFFDHVQRRPDHVHEAL